MTTFDAGAVLSARTEPLFFLPPSSGVPVGDVFTPTSGDPARLLIVVRLRSCLGDWCGEASARLTVVLSREGSEVTPTLAAVLFLRVLRFFAWPFATAVSSMLCGESTDVSLASVREGARMFSRMLLFAGVLVLYLALPVLGLNSPVLLVLLVLLLVVDRLGAVDSLRRVGVVDVLLLVVLLVLFVVLVRLILLSVPGLCSVDNLEVRLPLPLLSTTAGSAPLLVVLRFTLPNRLVRLITLLFLLLLAPVLLLFSASPSSDTVFTLPSSVIVLVFRGVMLP